MVLTPNGITIDSVTRLASPNAPGIRLDRYHRDALLHQKEPEAPLWNSLLRDLRRGPKAFRLQRRRRSGDAAYLRSNRHLQLHGDASTLRLEVGRVLHAEPFHPGRSQSGRDTLWRPSAAASC